MPTKPSTTFVFATDANFSAGPAAGNPTKIVPASPAQGFIPGNAITPEGVNYLFNLSGEWITDWLDLGTAAADLDAHIVETDANGSSAIAALDLGGTASAIQALTVENNSGFSGSAATFTNSSTGFGAVCNAAGALAGCRGTNSGSGPGVEGLALGTGLGGKFTGAGSSAGVEAVGGANGPGLTAEGNGTASGIVATRAASGGAAIEAKCDGGSPVRGNIWIQPNISPSAPIDGDLWKISGTAGFGRGYFRFYDNDGAAGGGSGGEQTVWSTSAGFGRRYAEDNSSSTSTLTSFTSKLSLSIGSAASPGEPDGKYSIRYTCGVELAAGAALTTRAIVEIRINGVTKETSEVDFSGLGHDKRITGFFQDTLAGATRTYEIRFRSSSAGNGVTIFDARIEAVGAYE